MNLSIRTRIAGLAVGTAVAISVAGSAFAASSPASPAALPADESPAACATQREAAKTDATVAALRAVGDCEIDRRLTTIGTLQALVSKSNLLTAGDRSALESKLAATKSGLQALETKIDADTTVAELRTDLPKIVQDYRVYVLVARQVHLVNAADGVNVAASKFQQLSTKLQARIDAAKQAGKDVTAAQAALDAMNAAVTDAQKLAAPIPAAVLALTPAQYNAGAAGPILSRARASLKTARNDMKTARGDAREVAQALR